MDGVLESTYIGEKIAEKGVAFCSFLGRTWRWVRGTKNKSYQIGLDLQSFNRIYCEKNYKEIKTGHLFTWSDSFSKLWVCIKLLVGFHEKQSCEGEDHFCYPKSVERARLPLSSKLPLEEERSTPSEKKLLRFLGCQERVESYAAKEAMLRFYRDNCKIFRKSKLCIALLRGLDEHTKLMFLTECRFFEAFDLARGLERGLDTPIYTFHVMRDHFLLDRQWSVDEVEKRVITLINDSQIEKNILDEILQIEQIGYLLRVDLLKMAGSANRERFVEKVAKYLKSSSKNSTQSLIEYGLEVAAEQDSINAMVLLEQLYRDGGEKIDRAHRLAKKLERLTGSTHYSFQVMRDYFLGSGTLQDIEEAEQIAYSLLQNEGIEESMQNTILALWQVAKLLHATDPTLIDYTELEKLMTKEKNFCRQIESDTLYRLADGSAFSKRFCIELYQTAAERGHINSMIVLEDRYRNEYKIYPEAKLYAHRFANQLQEALGSSYYALQVIEDHFLHFTSGCSLEHAKQRATSLSQDLEIEKSARKKAEIYLSAMEILKKPTTQIEPTDLHDLKLFLEKLFPDAQSHQRAIKVLGNKHSAVRYLQRANRGAAAREIGWEQASVDLSSRAKKKRR